MPIKKASKGIKLEFDEEDDTKYEDKPLKKAKVPYMYNPKVRTVDKFLPLYKKILTKLVYIIEDFIEYIKDIISLDKDKVVYKTTFFAKRNYNATLNIMKHIKIEVMKIKAGFKKLYNDAKFFWKTSRKMY